MLLLLVFLVIVEEQVFEEVSGGHCRLDWDLRWGGGGPLVAVECYPEI